MRTDEKRRGGMVCLSRLMSVNWRLREARVWSRKERAYSREYCSRVYTDMAAALDLTSDRAALPPSPRSALTFSTATTCSA